MKKNYMIKDKLLALNTENKLKYFVFSLGRTKELYDLFIQEINNNNLQYLDEYLEGSKILNEIYTYLKQNLKKVNQDQISNYISKSFELTIHSDDYSSFQSTIATQVALLSSSVLEFFQDKKLELFEEVEMNISEIINIIESEKFYSKNPDGDYKQCDSIVNNVIKQDLNNQLDFLNSIDLTNVNIDFLVDKYKISFN